MWFNGSFNVGSDDSITHHCHQQQPLILVVNMWYASVHNSAANRDQLLIMYNDMISLYITIETSCYFGT